MLSHDERKQTHGAGVNVGGTDGVNSGPNVGGAKYGGAAGHVYIPLEGAGYELVEHATPATPFVQYVSSLVAV